MMKVWVVACWFEKPNNVDTDFVVFAEYERAKAYADVKNAEGNAYDDWDCFEREMEVNSA
jgi:hypothetical protein